MRARILTGLLVAVLVVGAVLPSFLMPQTVYAATETLRPNAAGDETSISFQYPTSTYHWDKVDEATADEASTYVYTNSISGQRDLYNLPAHSGSGTINSITVYVRCATSVGYGYLYVAMRTGGTTYQGSIETADTSWANFSKQWTQNPDTETAWTWDDIDALQIGVKLYIDNVAYINRCTQVWVVIDYTVASAPTVVTNAASSVEETTATVNGNVTAVNDTNITTRGFVWDTLTHGNPGNVAPASSGYASNWTESGSWTTGSFSHGLTSLDEGELYYFRACAYNNAGYWGYGDEEVFLTKPDPPSTFTATAAGADQIDLAWTNGDGSQKVYIIGKEDSAPTGRGDYDWTWNGTGTGTSHTGLSGGEHWYYQIWSYATEGGETQTSDTPDLTDDATTTSPPSVLSLRVEGTGSDPDGGWVILRGQVADDEGLAIDTVGFEYGLTAGYGYDVSVSGDWNTGDVFVLRIGGLAQGTQYHWRAFASAGAVTGYGDDMHVATKGSPVIYEYLNTGGDGDGVAGGIYGNNWAAQQFTVGETSHTTTFARVYLKRVLAPGTVTISLKHVDESGYPTGDDLCSTTLDGDAFSTSYTWYKVDWDTEISLEGGEEYALVIRAVAGDGSNYIQWRWDSGGGLADAVGCYSTDGGITWASSTPADYLFEIWGESCLRVLSGAVFEDYYEDGDMLFTCEYLNIYPPYYDSYVCRQYFVIQLLDTDGVTVIAQTSCLQWGNMPGSVYINPDGAASLTPEAEYYIRIYGVFTGNPVGSYQLQASDWKGSDLTQLDDWVLTTAHDMEDYYGVDLTTYISGQGEALNAEGGLVFLRGISALDEIRPDLFSVQVSTEGWDDEDWTNAYLDVTDWETEVGPDAAEIINTGGDMIGMEGKDLLAFVVLGGYLLVVFAVVGVGKRFAGAGYMGAGLAIPVLWAGAELRALDFTYIGVTATLALFMLVYSLFIARS